MSLAFTQIRNNITYRLQNVEFDKFLERRDDGNGTLVMRPLRNSTTAITLRQQWYITPDKNSVYEIHNINEEGSALISKDGQGNVLAITATATASSHEWHFKPIDPNNSKSPFYVYHKDSRPRSYIMLYVMDDGTVATSKETFTTASRINSPEEYQWKVVEVTPALLPEPKKKEDPRYRIRTLNGATLNADGEKLTIGETNEGTARHWLIEDKGNGRCTLQNAQNKKYLAASGSDSLWIPGLSANPTFWDIEAIGPYNHALCIERPYATGTNNNSLQSSTFALTVSKDTVLFKPMKTAHNQIWLIEPVDAPLDGDEGGPNQGQGGQGGLPNGLTKGDYKLRNERLANYIYVDARKNPPTFQFDTSDGANPFFISFSGSLVYISYDVGFGRQYLSITNNSLAASATEYGWRFERGSNLPGRYYIYSGNMALCANVAARMVAVQQRTSTNEELWFLESA